MKRTFLAALSLLLCACLSACNSFGEGKTPDASSLAAAAPSTSAPMAVPQEAPAPEAEAPGYLLFENTATNATLLVSDPAVIAELTQAYEALRNSGSTQYWFENENTESGRPDFDILLIQGGSNVRWWPYVKNTAISHGEEQMALDSIVEKALASAEEMSAYAFSLAQPAQYLQVAHLLEAGYSGRVYCTRKNLALQYSTLRLNYSRVGTEEEREEADRLQRDDYEGQALGVFPSDDIFLTVIDHLNELNLIEAVSPVRPAESGPTFTREITLYLRRHLYEQSLAELRDIWAAALTPPAYEAFTDDNFQYTQNDSFVFTLLTKSPLSGEELSQIQKDYDLSLEPADGNQTPA